MATEGVGMGEQWRLERDALGEVRVPHNAYYGAGTVRAVENFRITGRKPRPELIRALALVKIAAAWANSAVAAVDPELGNAIARAGKEVAGGELADQFLVDPYEAGAGTSTHMNVNEVLANRAEEIITGQYGEYARVHPNDHVNASQSSNDVFPTAVRIAILEKDRTLLQELQRLVDAFRAKGGEFADMVKAGRTHLQDAVPITLGQEFDAFAEMVDRAAGRIDQTARERVARLPLGGTATGTGFGTKPGYADRALTRLVELTELPLHAAEDRIEMIRNHGDLGEFAGALKGLAVALSQVCNDLRLMSMGPRTGLAEIELPEVQPGSSITPGKVNPAVPEMVNMVCMRVRGAEHTVSLAVEAGQLDMNVMIPVIADEILESMQLLERAATTLSDSCIMGIRPHPERLRTYAETSLGLAAALQPALGFARAADIAMKAYRRGRTIKQVVEEERVLSANEVDTLMDPARYTDPP
jgi:aspartate ammonia-lyase